MQWGKMHLSRMQQLQKNKCESLDSVASVVLPCRPMAPESNQEQQGQGNMISLMLFMAATTVLTCSLLLMYTATWVLVSRVPQMALTSSSLAHGALLLILASILALAVSIVVCSAHGRERSMGVWPVMLLLGAVTLAALGAGVSVSIVYRIGFQFEPQRVYINSPQERLLTPDVKLPLIQLSMGSFRNNLGLVMREALHCCGQSWDSVQTKLECCGVENWTDWIQVRTVLPPSCCPNGMKSNCGPENAFQSGCLDATALDLAGGASLMAGIGLIMVVIMLIIVILSTCLWVRDARTRNVAGVLSVQSVDEGSLLTMASQSPSPIAI